MNNSKLEQKLELSKSQTIMQKPQTRINKNSQPKREFILANLILCVPNTILK